jgi:small multidrug resistance family-3 protein
MPLIAWLIFVLAAILEVGGDAVIRTGLRGERLTFIIIGGLMLGGYGVVVNLVKWDFSKLLGVYVAVFACVSVCWGRFVFKEEVPLSTWMGLVLIILGGFVIQFGHGSE